MKKVRMMLLCVAFVLMAAGCAGKSSKESEEWIEESAAKISEEITSGQFVIDDVVYQFPMELQFWLDNGWHISNRYDNVDEFALEAGYESTEFELFNEEEQYVKVAVYNDTYEDISVEEGIVTYLYMSLSEVDAVFPQGMTKRNKPADILEAYGEPDAEGDETGYLEASYIFDDDDIGKCCVELDVFDNDYTIDPFTSVSYSMLSFDEYWDTLVKSEGEDGASKIYIDATMKASMYGDIDDYVDYAIDSKNGALELYDVEAEYFATALMYYADINENYISEEQTDRLIKVAKDVLSKVKWEVKSVEIGHFNEGTVTMVLYPTNFFDVIEDDVFVAIDAFYEKYADVDFETMDEAEYAVAETEYTASVLEIFEKNVGKAGTLDAVEKVYDMDIDEGIFSEEAWLDIDCTLMDLYEEE